MLRPALALTLLVGVVAASVAAADPLVPPLNEDTRALALPASFTSVVIDVDQGDVSLTPGRVKGSVHRTWMTEEPSLSTAVKQGVLTITARCPDESVGAGGVYVGLVGFEECRQDLTLSLPSSVPVRAKGTGVTVRGWKAPLQVDALGPVDVSGSGPGAVRLNSLAGPVTLTGSRPSKTTVLADSQARVSDVSTSVLDVSSRVSGVDLQRSRAEQVLVRSDSSASLRDVRARTATVRSSVSAVSLTDVALDGALTVTADSSAALVRVRSAAADVRSSVSSVQLSDVVAKGPLSVLASSSATLQRVSADQADVRSSVSLASLEDVTVRGALNVDADSSATLARVRARAAEVRSQVSSVEVSSSRFATRLRVAADSAAGLDAVTTPVADVQSHVSSLTVKGSSIRDLVGRADSAVDVSLAEIPSRVVLDSAVSSLQLRVPRASYAVEARSARGHVEYGDLVVDQRAPRALRLTADGDIRIN